MTEQEIKAEIKRILKVNISKELVKDRKKIECDFCGWKPRNYGWGIHPSSLLSHLAYRHPGQYKTRTDMLYDLFVSLHEGRDLCAATLGLESTTRKQKKM